MDNLTSNYTSYNDARPLLHAPGFIAFNVVMLIGCILPAAVLDISILVAFTVDKVTPGKIRFILANFLLVGLVMMFLLTLEHLIALVLVTTDHPLPPVDLCSTILWALFGACALRLTLTATFSVVVFIMIVKGIKAIGKIAVVISVIILWTVCFFSLNIPLLVLPGNNGYVAGAACLPVGKNGSNDEVYMALYIIVFGMVPLFISIVMPIVTFVYLFKHKTSESSNVPFLKAMVKLSAFLVLGGLLNFTGQGLPAVITKVAFSVLNESIPGETVFYTSLTLFDLSLWPTPILIFMYVQSMRTFVRKVLYFMKCRRHHLYPLSGTTTANIKALECPRVSDA